MKRVCALLLVLALMVPLVACSNEVANTSSDGEKPSQAAKSVDSETEKSGEKILSDWVDELPEGEKAVYTRNLYRFRDCVRETKEDDAPKLSGWNQYDSRTEQGEWSDWSDSEFTASKDREVETQHNLIST